MLLVQTEEFKLIHPAKIQKKDLIIKESSTFTGQKKGIMIVVETIASLNKIITNSKKEGQSIGFVPTMGALHQGHVSLLEHARSENDKTICSIYINPTQFNDKDDLEHYPRQLKQDLKKLEKMACDVVFIPSNEEMYPNGFIVNHFELNDLDKSMEGKHRPGHFNGVCTVVSKLFEVVRPNNAYFGRKDFQQLAIIRELNKTKGFMINIVGCPTFREKDGLAMSSRNALLNNKERVLASAIYRILLSAKQKYNNTSLNDIKNWVEKELNAIDSFAIDYVEIVNPNTLQVVTNDEKKKSAILCVAVFLGSVRLIDNILLN